MLIRISDINNIEKYRPDGYKKNVISLGKISGDFLEISEQNYLVLLKKYRTSQPSMMDKFRGLSGTLLKFAKSGFLLTESTLLKQRIKICGKCSKWDKEAFGGRGKCGICGCSVLKHYILVAKCPMGKW